MGTIILLILILLVLVAILITSSSSLSTIQEQNKQTYGQLYDMKEIFEFSASKISDLNDNLDSINSNILDLRHQAENGSSLFQVGSLKSSLPAMR